MTDFPLCIMQYNLTAPQTAAFKMIRKMNEHLSLLHVYSLPIFSHPDCLYSHFTTLRVIICIGCLRIEGVT